MVTTFCPSPEDVPSVAGAYVLAIRLAKPLAVTIARRRAGTLPAGQYLYCGSANGRGGLKSRLRRHMRRGKTIRWHVDQLTEHGTVEGAWIFPGGNECDLVAALSHLPMPIPGFGSTDCRQCRSHLLAGSDDIPPWLRIVRGRRLPEGKPRAGRVPPSAPARP